MDNVDKFMLTGTITNMDTGKASEVSQYFYPYDARMNAVVKIVEANMSKYEESTSSPIEVSVNCLALDSMCDIFKLELYFSFGWEARELANEVLRQLKAGEMVAIRGTYTISDKEPHFTLYDPEIAQIPTEDREHFELAFIHNQSN